MSKASKKTPVATGTNDDRALTIARWSVIAIAALVPLATSNFTWLGFAHPFTANQVDLIKLLVMVVGLVIGFSGWMVHLFSQKPSLRISPAMWIALAALVLSTMSALLAQDVSAAVLGRDPRYVGLVTLAGFLAAFYLTTQVMRTRADKRLLVRTLTVSATLVAAYGVLQHFGIDPVNWGDMGFEATRASSTFGNPVPLGTFLAGSLPIAAALALAEEDRRAKIALWLAFVVQAVAVFATFTRGAWIGTAAALLVLGVAGLRQKTRLERIDLVGVVGALACVGLVAVLSLSSGNIHTNVAARVSETVNTETGSGGQRLTSWRTAVVAIGQRPLQGWGPEGFRWAYAKLRPTEVIALDGPVALADDTHDYPLMLAVTLGVPGALATLGLLLYVMWLALPLVFRPRPEEGLPIQAGYLAAMAGTLVCLLLAISSSASLVVLWIFAGALLPTSPASGKRPVLAGRIVAAVTVLAAAIALVFVGGFVRADNYFVKGRTATSLDDRLRYYGLASAAAQRSDAYAQALGNTYSLAAQQAIAQARQMQGQGQDPSAAVKAASDFIAKGAAALTAATRIAPAESTNYTDLARLHLLAGTNIDEAALAKAETAITASLERSPKAPHALALHAQILMAQGRTAEALAEAEKAASIYRDGTTLSTLGQARLASGDRAGAIQALEEAQKAAPDDASIAQQLAAAKAAK